MKSKFLKKLIPFVILLAVVATFSSCNRGMGCPQFSVDSIAKVVVELPEAIVNK